MAKKPSSPDLMRRKPLQSRAEETVEAIFEASARILEQEGEEGLTTNRLAERSGFSIGALYHYFPNKEAILFAMAQREAAKMRTEILALLRDGHDLPRSDLARRTVRALLQAFGGRNRARRLIIEAVIKGGRVPEAQKMLAGVAEEIFAELHATLSPAAAFVLTRGLMGAIRAAVIEASPLLRAQEFEDELVNLICRSLPA